MPFYYDLPMPTLGAKASQVKLERWLAKPRDWLETGTAVAVASVGDDRFEVLVNGPGVLGKLLREAGSTVSAGEPIAVMHADGESIPYGKPYSVARRA